MDDLKVRTAERAWQNHVKGKGTCFSRQQRRLAKIFEKWNAWPSLPTIYSEDKTLQVVDLCQNANEAMVKPRCYDADFAVNQSTSSNGRS